VARWLANFTAAKKTKSKIARGNSETAREKLAKANGALNVVTNSHKGIRRAGSQRGAIGRTENVAEIYWPRQDLFDAFKCLLYRAGRRARIHTRAFPASKPHPRFRSFSILDGFARRPSVEIFEVFSHERRRVAPTTRARRCGGRNRVKFARTLRCFSPENFSNDSGIFGALHDTFTSLILTN